MNECFFRLQDLEKAYRDRDAARRNLRDLKEAHVIALRSQSAAFEQTLEDAKTVAAQVLPASSAQLAPLSCRICQTPASASISLAQNSRFAECL